MTQTDRLQRAAERRDLTQGPITKKIILFSIPIIFGNLFQQLYNVVDSVVVGNFAADGTHCLAAVNASFAIMMVFNALYMGVSMGANIVISQYKGAKDVRKLEDAMTTTFLLSMLAGLFITVVGFICAKPMLRMLGTPADILENIALGVDMFDCVMPTRNGSNANIFTWDGMMNMRNEKWKFDFSPIDANSDLEADRIYSRAYLRHLYAANEILGPMIGSLHNLHFYLELVSTARRKIEEGTFAEWKNEIVPKLKRKL